MKKTLLSLGLAAFAFVANAQTSYIIFDGTAKGKCNSDPYSFGADPAKLTKDTVNSEVYLTLAGGTKAGYAGGGGIADWGNPLGYAGKVATSALVFDAFTKSTSPGFQIQFKTTTGAVFGYSWSFKDSAAVKTGFSRVLALVSDFKLKSKAGVFDSTVVTDAELMGAQSEIQFVLTVGDGETSGSVSFDNLTFVTVGALGIQDNFLSSTKDEVVSVYNIMGAFVATGKLADLNLEAGKLYVVKAGNTTRKIVMN